MAFQERQRGTENQQRDKQLGIDQQRATSDVNLQGAQADEIRERIRQRKVQQDIFTPKPDPGAAAVSTDTSGTAPGANAAAPAMRSDFDRIVDNADLPDGLKNSIKYNGKAQAAAGKPEEGFNFLQKVLIGFDKRVTPHPILNEAGLPYAVVDKFGEPWELHDPNMPAQLRPLANAAMDAYKQKNILPPMDVENANTANHRRWQVLHPGQPLPGDLTLPPNASKDEYARIEKQFGDLTQLEGVKAQRDAANAARNAGRDQRDTTIGMTPVIGQDPKTGKDVLVPQSDADKMGLTGVMKAEAADVSKSLAARHWMPLAEKSVTIQRENPNDPMSPAKNADQMGVLQLIDDLDKRGKLGVVASRWNDFMAGNVGAGDPEMEALRVKMGLSTTLLMNVHVGQRGGSYMMEHFEDLANAGKMNAQTLKSGVRSELDYVRDRAMLPSGGGNVSTPKAGGFSPDNPFAPKRPQ